MSISHRQKCTMGLDGICIPSLSLSLSPAIILSSFVSPPLPPSWPSCPSFSLLSPQSDQELILWILTLIQWDSYNPLSDYGPHTHIQTHSCLHIKHRHAPRKCTLCQIQHINTWYTSLHDWCPCKSSAKSKGEVGLLVSVCMWEVFNTILKCCTDCKFVILYLCLSKWLYVCYTVYIWFV